VAIMPDVPRVVTLIPRIRLFQRRIKSMRLAAWPLAQFLAKMKQNGQPGWYGAQSTAKASPNEH